VLIARTTIAERAFTRAAQVKRPAEHHLRARLAPERLVATDLHGHPLSEAGGIVASSVIPLWMLDPIEHAALERGSESVRMIEVIMRIVRHAEALHHAL